MGHPVLLLRSVVFWYSSKNNLSLLILLCGLGCGRGNVKSVNPISVSRLTVWEPFAYELKVVGPLTQLNTCLHLYGVEHLQGGGN
jgi:hypothetical protein